MFAALWEPPVKEEYRVERVYDGDTFNVHFPGLPESLQPLSIRVAGVDTPEIGNRARCRLEAELGDRTRRFVVAELEGEVVELEFVDWDRYGGRVVADVVFEEDRNLSSELIERGLAVEYHGSGPRENWCD